MVLSLSGISVRLLALNAPALSQGVVVGTEITSLSCHLESEALVNVQRDSKHISGSRCRETIKNPPCTLVRSCKGFLHTLLV